MVEREEQVNKYSGFIDTFGPALLYRLLARIVSIVMTFSFSRNIRLHLHDDFGADVGEHRRAGEELEEKE